MGAEQPAGSNLSKQFKERLADASLIEKRRLLHEWAVTVVVELGAMATTADPKFAGVRNTGQLVTQLDFSRPIDVQRVLFSNENYWRGVMEMSQGNHLIAVMPVFLHLANGEWGRAESCGQILNLYSLEKSLAGQKLNEAMAYLSVCAGAVNKEIKRGIALHDKGRYTDAERIYQGILDAGIRSAWARYELFFSKATAAGGQHLVDIASGKAVDEWDVAAKEIYAFDPLYTSQFVGRRGKTMGALQARLQLGELNRTKSGSSGERLARYADLALKLEAYSTAAQLYWFRLSLKDQESSLDENITRFFYCLERMEVTGLKQNFKGPFEDKFKVLDQELTAYRQM